MRPGPIRPCPVTPWASRQSQDRRAPAAPHSRDVLSQPPGFSALNYISLFLAPLGFFFSADRTFRSQISAQVSALSGGHCDWRS